MATIVPSLPRFHTFSAVSETSLIASLLRQHPINLLNKVHSLAVLFVENQGAGGGGSSLRAESGLPGLPGLGPSHSSGKSEPL